MKHGSLFSGIGGFDLAAEWMGWENVFHCEWNPFGRRILSHYWPNAISYEDITKTDFTIHRGTIDILTGGFPCQPYSTAGKRKGTEDPRHLWPQMLRTVREIRPRYVVAENVRGIINWKKGLVFHDVQTDLENEGYEVQPFLLPACGVNAPHQRYRTWFVAYSDLHGHKLRGSGEDRQKERKSKEKENKRERLRDDARGNGQQGTTTNAKNTRLQRRQNVGISGKCRAESHEQLAGFFCPDWENFPTQSPICSRNDGIPARLDGITFPKWREESIKAYGNAIVPQVAFEIFKAIEETETIIRSKD